MREELLTNCGGGELADESWDGFIIHERDIVPFTRRLHHDGIADGYGDDFDRYGSTFTTSYVLGHFGTGATVGDRVVDSTGTWELVGSWGGESEVECPGQRWDMKAERDAKGGETFKVKHAEAQLTPKPEVRHTSGRWYGDKRPNGRHAECIYCEERVGEEHGYLGDYVTIEVWKLIAERPEREEIAGTRGRTGK